MTVSIEPNALDALIPMINTLSPAHTVIITDSNVGPLHVQTILKALTDHGISSHVLTVQAGETSKSRERKAWLEDALSDFGCGRDTLIIALGGGMITDLAGFVAATYCRGIPIICLPTSLMGMVDAAIGGKNGINTIHGKNKIGTIRLPHAVLIQLSYLDTLPDHEYHMALSEVVKHALIADAKLFQFINDKSEKILARDFDCVAHLVERSVAIKQSFTNTDLLEKNLREALNFGHTIGHAIEHASHYEISHGQAVSLGLHYESKLSVSLGLLDRTDFEKIESLLRVLNLLQHPENYSIENTLKALTYDKKNRLGEVRCVLLSAIGNVHAADGCVAQPVEMSEFSNVLARPTT